jgi:hypothetical protein
MNEVIAIQNTDFWVKIVEMLQQNWAVIEPKDAETVHVYFISDTSGVFDEMAFRSANAARESLHRNGFRRFAKNGDMQSFLRPPPGPFHRVVHPNGPIYSSGRFWRS